MKRLHIITIVYNGMPTITWHLPVFNRLTGIDWTWHIVEGPALNVGCTSWCKPLNPGSSSDGTAEYLAGLSRHPRVKVYTKRIWDGKLEMVNAPAADIKEGGYVFEIDCDELWTARQIETAVHMMECDMGNNAMLFSCRYFLGHDIVITSKNGYGNHRAYEWRRLWRAGKCFKFTKHEPPEVDMETMWRKHDETESAGLVFDHYAYVFPQQVSFKERYYGYACALEKWKALQANTRWPVDASKFLDWVEPKTIADKLFQPCS